jgi:predicted dehydrogenase/threonine dehydrogenase-like Zn-dependent dehydrogenase
VKQVLQDRSGNTVVRDVPEPSCPHGSLLVRNAFSVISAGTERARVELSKKSLLAKARERPDLVAQVVERARREGLRATREAVRRRLIEETAVGYSSAGIVVEVGAGVAGFEVGDRVACAGGGHANHAEVVAVPANLCARVPDGVPLETAAMSTIAAIALHGIRLAGVELGDRVAVIGCGLVGQIACRLLTAAGAEVLAFDIDEGRVAQAIEGGAHHGAVVGDAKNLVLAATSGVGVDKIVITAAAPTNDPLLLASTIARDRGDIVLVGDVPVQMPRAALYDKELSFRISRSYGPGRYDLDYEERGLDYPIGYVRWTEKRNLEAVLELQQRGALTLTDLVDEVFPVDDAAQAYEQLVSGGARGALILSYDGDAPSATREPIHAATTPVPAPVPRRGVAHAPRIGLVGAGSFAGRVLVPALVAAGARLELVGGGRGPSAEAATRNLGFARVAPDEEAVIADPDVDAVVVATQHGTHAELVARALAAGKHVFCEKPLALTQVELQAVLDVAGRSDGILAVGFNRRFAPLLRRAVEFVRPGEERVVGIYRVSAGALPPEHWTHDLEHGGGRLLGEGCHFVDSLAFLAGSPVSDVFATGYGAPSAPVQARDNVVVSLTFANGSTGSIAYIADGSGKVAKERLEAFAGSRTAILDDYRSLELAGATTERVSERTQDKGHDAEIAAFLAGIRSGVPPVALEEVANVSLATLAIVESLRTARPVRLTARDS